MAGIPLDVRHMQYVRHENFFTASIFCLARIAKMILLRSSVFPNGSLSLLMVPGYDC